jgi:DNA-binding NtrC family response regulator
VICVTIGMMKDCEENRAILVVDDDECLLALIKEIFSRTELTVHTASSVADALQKLDEVRVSLVLLDWTFRPTGMPVIGQDAFGGKPVLEKCLTIDSYLPVVVMSSYNAVDVLDVAWDNGAVSFVPKPLKVASLVKHVRDLVRRYARTQCRFQLTSIEEIRPLDEIEREYVESVVATVGTLKEAAKRLGKTRQTLAKILNRAGQEIIKEESCGPKILGQMKDFNGKKSPLKESTTL